MRKNGSPKNSFRLKLLDWKPCNKMNLRLKTKKISSAIKITIKMPYHHKSIFNHLMLTKKNVKSAVPSLTLHMITNCFRPETLISKYRKIDQRIQERRFPESLLIKSLKPNLNAKHNSRSSDLELWFRV